MILQPDAKGKIDDFIVMDVRRELIDAPNPLSTYARLINRAIGYLHQGRLVICCSAGVSRSNALAIGLLTIEYGMNFEAAVTLVKEKVPIADPSMCHLRQIRKLTLDYCRRIDRPRRQKDES